MQVSSSTELISCLYYVDESSIILLWIILAFSPVIWNFGHKTVPTREPHSRRAKPAYLAR
jgi:hypothetical protein